MRIYLHIHRKRGSKIVSHLVISTSHRCRINGLCLLSVAPLDSMHATCRASSIGRLGARFYVVFFLLLGVFLNVVKAF